MKIANFLRHPARKRLGFQCFVATPMFERRVAASKPPSFKSRPADFSLGDFVAVPA
jgi:hypothetical protein